MLAGENHKKWLPPFYKYFFFILIWRQSVLPPPSCPHFHFVWAFLTHNFLLVFLSPPSPSATLGKMAAMSCRFVCISGCFNNVLYFGFFLRGESNSRPVYGGFSYETENVLSSWTWILSVCVCVLQYLRSVYEEGVGNSSSRLPFPVGAALAQLLDFWLLTHDWHARKLVIF